MKIQLLKNFLKFTTVVFFFLNIVGKEVKGQMVYIPDAGFKTALGYLGYSSCIVGDSIDSSCPAITNSLKLDLTRNFHIHNVYIYDLQGIEAFVNLDTLICRYHPLTTIPSLPNSIVYADLYYNSLLNLPPLSNSLTFLNCGSNKLTSLPTLPVSLKHLDCSFDSISVLPPLPGQLVYLACYNNYLDSLPNLPSSLMALYCDHNDLTQLPDLPSSLTWLSCSYNSLSSLPVSISSTSLTTLICEFTSLTSLPILPNTLDSLWCGYCQLTSLPILPLSLQILVCVENNLTTLPTLPSGLTQLYCSWNQLGFLPNLPPSLHHLNCGENNLTSLPTLPSGITSLWCAWNQLGFLPNLPPTLEFLDVWNCQLTSIPVLPPNLQMLQVTGNHITSLPNLPQGLKELYAHHCELNSLPVLPSSLVLLSCSNNHLSSLPEFPDSLGHLDIENNPLTCLPKIKTINNFYWDSTNVTCLPNYGTVHNSIPLLTSIPLCDVLNQNNCNFYWNISGQTYFDENVNCSFDSTDVGKQNMHLMLFKNGILQQQMFTGGEGYYSFDTDTSGIYSVKLDTTNIQFSLFCPANDSYVDTLTSTDSLFYNNNFSLKCKPGFDVGAWCVYAWHLKPAMYSTVHISAGDLSNFYGAHCATGISGTVTISMNGSVHYISPSPGALTPANVTGNIITYNIPDFGAISLFNAFNFIVQTDTNAIINTPVCIHVAVTSSGIDNNPANDTLTQCFNIVNSWDPNEKEVYPSGDVDLNGDGWLTYTIHFQNTGTATAEHIYITDTLDANLDLATFQLLAYSFQPVVQILDGGIARFNFPNINLPDSNSNEPASHGFIQYKIKLKNNLSPGTHINNTAYIYFDFNAPVVTNTTSSTLQFLTTVASVVENDLQFSIYPNPAHDEFTVYCPHFRADKKITVKIFDVLGEEVLSSMMHGATCRLSTTRLSKGIYFIEINSGNRSVKKKLVVD